MNLNLKELELQYKNELLDNILLFGCKNHKIKNAEDISLALIVKATFSIQTNLSVLQGRQVWLFSMLYNKVEKKREWLDCAIEGAEFLKKYGHDVQLQLVIFTYPRRQTTYRSLQYFFLHICINGIWTIKPCYRNEEYAEIAQRTFDIILSKVDNPKGKWNKAHPGTRNLKNFALPMILAIYRWKLNNYSMRNSLQKRWRMYP
jgi:N-acylglucosamine 2-epimerase